MDRREFERLVFPLSDKEILYRDHPEEAEKVFKEVWSHSRDTDGTYVLDIAPEQTRRGHGLLYPGQPSTSPHPYLSMNKQTRYSIIPPHRHTYFEMFYVYAGKCETLINGQRMTLSEDDVCIMDTQAVHTIGPIGEGDVVLNCLMARPYFNDAFIERLARSGVVAQFLAVALSTTTYHDQYLLFHTADEPLIRDTFEAAFCEYLDPGICSADLLDSYFSLIFIQLARCYQTAQEKNDNNERPYITEVLAYIERAATTCTLTQTAERFGYHPNYLSRALKKATGFSFKELVDQTRLRQAAHLLEHTEASISEIAAACGWSNERQFYKKFQEGFCCTPGEWRKSGCTLR